MTESPADMLSRVEQMSIDNGSTWDLSGNDQLALAYVIRHVRNLEAEVERLRKLIRCEQIEPPFDCADDCTTQLAVELTAAKNRIAKLEDALRPFASPTCAEILDGMDDDEDVPMTYSAGTIRAAAAALEGK